MPDTSWKNSRIALYLITFLFNLHVAIPTYIFSSFIAGFTGNATVGIVYTAASLLAIVAFGAILKILRRFGNVNVTVALLVAELISLLVLALVQAASGNGFFKWSVFGYRSYQLYARRAS